jgi:hypothetical protein
MGSDAGNTGPVSATLERYRALSRRRTDPAHPTPLRYGPGHPSSPGPYGPLVFPFQVAVLSAGRRGLHRRSWCSPSSDPGCSHGWTWSAPAGRRRGVRVNERPVADPRCIGSDAPRGERGPLGAAAHAGDHLPRCRVNEAGPRPLREIGPGVESVTGCGDRPTSTSTSSREFHLDLVLTAGPEPRNCSRTSRYAASWDMSFTYQVSFTTSANVAPEDSSAVLRFRTPARSALVHLPTHEVPLSSSGTCPEM